jgi:hypothetical protein
MRRRTNLIPPPLAWNMAAAPVSHPVIPVLAERGGTQLRTPTATVLVDSREQNPFDFQGSRPLHFASTWLNTIRLRRPCATFIHEKMRWRNCWRGWGTCGRPETRVKCKRSAQNAVQWELPSDADLAKILSACELHRAEVVELADTPS